MAGTLQGPAAASLDRTPYGTGKSSGGKIRSSRHQTLHQNEPLGAAVGSARDRTGYPAARRGPYDRPSAGRHATALGVQAAARRSLGSRILTGASSFLSSWFRKDNGHQNIALVPPREEKSLQQGFVSTDDRAEDIEDILKEQVFTREQCESFIQVLQSRLKDQVPPQVPVVNGLVDDRFPDDELEREYAGEREREADRKIPVDEAGMEDDDPGSSPVDIAKAYMDKRLSPVPGPTFSVRALDYTAGRTRDELPRIATPGNTPYTRDDFPRIATPGHTPYVRLRSGPGKVFDAGIRPTPYPVRSSAAREKKRRVVDDELDYSVRRTRLKMSNGPPLSTLPSASTEYGNGSYLDRMRNLQRKRVERKNKEDAAGPVPMQSSETARRILETLEILTPPKVKSLEEELTMVREKRPKELSPSMLNDQARKSMQAVECPVSEPGPGGPSNHIGEPSTSEVHPLQPAKSDIKGKSVITSSDMGPSVLGTMITVSSQSKGFRMNAAMEESNSDDEILPSSNPATSSPPATSSTVSPPASGSSPSSTLSTISTASPVTFSSISFPPAINIATESKPVYTVASTVSTSVSEPESSPGLNGSAVANGFTAVAFGSSSAAAASESKPVTTPSTNIFEGLISNNGVAGGPVTSSNIISNNAAVGGMSSSTKFLESAVVLNNDAGREKDVVVSKEAKKLGFTFEAESLNPSTFSSGGGFPSTGTETAQFPPSSSPSAVQFPSFSASSSASTVPFTFSGSSSFATLSSFSFGATASTTTSASTTTPSFSFGASTSTATTNTGSTVFGNSAQQAGFAINAASAGYGASTNNSSSTAFGGATANSASPVFGASANAGSTPFGASTNAASTTAFGASTNAASTGFGATTNAGGLFGASTNVASTTAFGASTNAASTGFGGTTNAGASGFGSDAAGSTGFARSPFPAFNLNANAGGGGGGGGDMVEHSMDDMAAEPSHAMLPPPTQPPTLFNTNASSSQPFVFGGPPSAVPSFNAPAPAFGGQAPAFGAPSSTPTFPSFGAAPSTTTTPAFGAPSSTPPAFGSTAPGFGVPQQQQPPFAQAAAAFGGQGGPPPFGAAAQAAGAPPPNANPFSGFSGAFSMGTEGGEHRPARKIFKPKRTGAAKRGGK